MRFQNFPVTIPPRASSSINDCIIIACLNWFIVAAVAVELAIAQAMRMDPIFGRVSQAKDARVAAIYSGRGKPQLFNGSKSMFTVRKRKLFV